MHATTTSEPMAKKKKSETRKHTGMARMDAYALDRVKLAARMMGMSAADYLSDVALKAADRDILREAKKLAGGEHK